MLMPDEMHLIVIRPGVKPKATTLSNRATMLWRDQPAEARNHREHYDQSRLPFP